MWSNLLNETLVHSFYQQCESFNYLYFSFNLFSQRSCVSYLCKHNQYLYRILFDLVRFLGRLHCCLKYYLNLLLNNLEIFSKNSKDLRVL